MEVEGARIDGRGEGVNAHEANEPEVGRIERIALRMPPPAHDPHGGLVAVQGNVAPTSPGSAYTPLAGSQPMWNGFSKTNHPIPTPPPSSTASRARHLAAARALHKAKMT